MPERPTISVREWVTHRVDSGKELAALLGRSVWIPVEWPLHGSVPEILSMSFPDDPEGAQGHDRRGYQFRGHDADGRLLVILGSRRDPRHHLPSGLRLLDGERFETWASPEDTPAQVVVRVPVFDVHVLGHDAISYDTAVRVARGLIEVAAG